MYRQRSSTDEKLHCALLRVVGSPNGNDCQCAHAGYELSLIEDSYGFIQDGNVNLAAKGWETSPFLVFLKTIPGRFYPIAMLFLQVRSRAQCCHAWLAGVSCSLEPCTKLCVFDRRRSVASTTHHSSPALITLIFYHCQHMLAHCFGDSRIKSSTRIHHTPTECTFCDDSCVLAAAVSDQLHGMCAHRCCSSSRSATGARCSTPSGARTARARFTQTMLTKRRCAPDSAASLLHVRLTKLACGAQCTPSALSTPARSPA